jgi:cytochrome c oxidase subunit 2
LRQRLPALRSGTFLASAVFSSLALSLGAGSAWANPLTPASPQARLTSDLFWLTMGIALVVLVAVEFLLIYTSLRFRKRAGTEPPEPAQIHGNTRLEVMWTILPAVILVSLFVVSARAMAELGSVPPGARAIQVSGRQFQWEFSYPEANVRSTNDLRVPVGLPVVLEITSQDVIHSFWVPDLAGKIDANPGLTSRLSFTASRAGVYRGVCAELCGAGHAIMLFVVTAMEPAEFENWLAEGGPAGEMAAAGPSPELGKRLLVDKGCAACHTIAGLPGMVGTLGPPLSNVATAAGNRKPGMSAEAYIRESISEPTAFTVAGFTPGVMLKIDLTATELDSIVAYLLTLK